jgi:hypothetical protein
MSKEKSVFRIIFANQREVYEIYAKSVSQSTMLGFIECEEFVFGDKQSVVIDPAEDKLSHEFRDVKRSYLPMHSVIRIDEVDRLGPVKVHTNGTVMPFPHAPLASSPKDVCE